MLYLRRQDPEYIPIENIDTIINPFIKFIDNLLQKRYLSFNPSNDIIFKRDFLSFRSNENMNTKYKETSEGGLAISVNMADC